MLSTNRLPTNNNLVALSKCSKPHPVLRMSPLPMLLQVLKKLLHLRVKHKHLLNKRHLRYHPLIISWLSARKQIYLETLNSSLRWAHTFLLSSNPRLTQKLSPNRRNQLRSTKVIRLPTSRMRFSLSPFMSPNLIKMARKWKKLAPLSYKSGTKIWSMMIWSENARSTLKIWNWFRRELLDSIWNSQRTERIQRPLELSSK